MVPKSLQTAESANVILVMLVGDATANAVDMGGALVLDAPVTKAGEERNAKSEDVLENSMIAV